MRQLIALWGCIFASITIIPIYTAGESRENHEDWSKRYNDTRRQREKAAKSRRHKRKNTRKTLASDNTTIQTERRDDMLKGMHEKSALLKANAQVYADNARALRKQAEQQSTGCSCIIL